MGDVTDLSNFIGAVIDERAFAKNKAAIDRAKEDPTCTIVAGGSYDDSVGYFVRPTVIVCTDPENEVFRTEYFGRSSRCTSTRTRSTTRCSSRWSRSRIRADGFGRRQRPRRGGPHGREAALRGGQLLHNDKSTGAVAAAAFGGGRASGTNDKAGAPQNLLRWTLTRAIKEALVAPTDYTYPHMG